MQAKISGASKGVAVGGTGVTVSASDTSQIEADTMGTSLAISAGIGAASAAGAGASATNVILDHADASISNATVTSSGAVTVTATSTPTITANILTQAFAAAVGIGASGALGVSIAHNYIGYTAGGTYTPDTVRATTSGASVSANGLFSETATNTATITANVAAVSMALTAAGGALSGAGVSAVNQIAVNTQTSITGSGASGINAGAITLSATDNSTISALVASASLAATYSGVAVALAVSLAQNSINNNVMSFIASAPVVKSTGATQVFATENATITALSAAAAASASFVGASGGGASASNSISANTKAYVASSGLNVGSLDIEAQDVSKATADTGVLSVAIGLTLAASGSVATDTITDNVSAYIDASNITDGAAATVRATAAPEGFANAAGLTAGLVAIGGSVATVTLRPTVSATVDGVINAGSLTVLAAVNLPSDGKASANAYAHGSGGGLATILASNATSNNTDVVTAAIGNLGASDVATGTVITLSGALVVAANNLTRQSTTGANSGGGLVAVGVAQGTSNATNTTKAGVGTNATISAGSASIGAGGDDNLFTETDAGSGGVAAGASVQPTNNDNATTTSTLGQGAKITTLAGGAVSISASHLATVNTKVVAATYGVLAGAGATAASNVNSNVSDIIAGAVTAYGISAVANNTFAKPVLGFSNGTPIDNISGDTGGLASGASGADTTTIAFSTLVDVQGSGALNVIGSTASPGALSLAATNNLSGYDQITFKTGGAISGAQAKATIQTTNDLAEVLVEGGATLNSIGQIKLAADGSANVTTQVNTNTYGAVTAALANSVIDIRPTNLVIVGTAGSSAATTITALGDLDLFTGEGGDFSSDPYYAHAYTDAFAGALIPLSSVDAHAFVVQTDRIVVNGSANLRTGGNANLLANNVGQADVFAQAKASSWASDVGNAILTLTGGNPANEFDGTSYEQAQGYIQIDGAVHTGIARNITVNFTYQNGASATNPVIVSDNPQVQFAFKTTTVSSKLVLDYENALAQLNVDKGVLSGNSNDAVLKQQVAFDNQEVSSIQAQLILQGLAEQESDGSIVVVEKTLQVIDIAPIRAQAGQIYLFADQVQGGGVLDAPTDVHVTITNSTLATLQIEGITIPQNIGGIYLNGSLLSQGSVSADNSAINASNASTAGRANAFAKGISGAPQEAIGVAAFSSITLAPPPAAPKGVSDAPAAIVIQNIAQPLTGDQIAAGVQQPDIIINGSIYAPYATLTVTSNNNIDISPTAQITDDGTTLTAKNNITIDQAVEQVTGDPASLLTNYSPANGTSALSSTTINNYQNSPIGALPRIHSQTITISSEYVDVNGNIQAGDAAPTLTINPADVAAQIKSIRDQGLATLQLLSLPSSANPFGEFLVFFNPVDSSIVVQPIIEGGGVITIQGHMSSTAHSSISAFGYFGNVTINNNTLYKLVVQGIDASQKGAGIVNITDFNFTDQQGDYRQVKYLTGLDSQGAPIVYSQTNYVNPTTGLAVTQGAISASSSTTASYNPLANLRYTFTISQGTKTQTDTIYYSSSWLGIINLGSGSKHLDPVTTTIAQPQIIGADSLYEVGVIGTPTVKYGNAADPSYTYLTSSQSVTLSDNIIKNWKTSTWYGKKTYYQENETITVTQTTYVHSIQADLPIAINFAGAASAGITVNSPYASVVVQGSLSNTTGRTKITSGGSISVSNANVQISGATVDLEAASDIGSAALPVEVVMASNAVGLTAQAANGSVYITAPQAAALPIVSIVAGGDNTVSLSANGALRAAGGGLVQGGVVTIVASGGVGASSAPLQLAVGQASADKLTLTASGDVFLEQKTGNLSLFALTTSGDANILVDSGSLVNVNSNAQVDPRTTQQLQSGVWSELALTGAQADDQIHGTLLEYQLSQQQQYQTYWSDVHALVNSTTKQPTNASDPNAVVALPAASLTYYRSVYAQQAAQQGLTGAAATAFVNSAITTLQLSATQQYYNLKSIFGAGGSYQPGVINTYNPASNTADAYNASVYDPNFTYLLTATEKANITGSIHVWTQSELLSGISAGLLQTTTSTQTTIEQPNITAKNIVIRATNGNIGSLVNPVANFNPTANVIGFQPGTNIDGAQAQIALAAAQLSDLNFLRAVPLVESVNFNGASMTLANGSSWSATSLGIQAGDYLYIGGVTQNATSNGAYLQVASVNGATITFTTSVVGENSKSVLIAPVVLNLQTTNQSTVGAVASANVNFGNVGNNGAITLTSGTWNGNYKVGGGVYVQSATDVNGNGAAFDLTRATPYYTIAAISADRKTLTLQWGQVLTVENGKTLGFAPVNVNLVSGASQVKFVLVSQSRDVALTPNGTVTASAGGFIYLGSQVTLNLNNVSAGSLGTPADVRIKTQGSLVDSAAPGAINVQGAGIVLEAGQGAIGAAGAPILVNVVGAGGNLTARAKNDIFIQAPVGDLPVEGVYSSLGGVWLNASGSIFDAVTSGFAKLQANWLELRAGANIGAGGDTAHALHIDLVHNVGGGVLGELRAYANGNIDIDQTADDLYVLDVFSRTGNVTLGAAGFLYNGGNLTDPTNLDFGDRRQQSVRERLRQFHHAQCRPNPAGRDRNGFCGLQHRQFVQRRRRQRRRERHGWGSEHLSLRGRNRPCDDLQRRHLALYRQRRRRRHGVHHRLHRLRSEWARRQQFHRRRR